MHRGNSKCMHTVFRSVFNLIKHWRSGENDARRHIQEHTGNIQRRTLYHNVKASSVPCCEHGQIFLSVLFCLFFLAGTDQGCCWARADLHRNRVWTCPAPDELFPGKVWPESSPRSHQGAERGAQPITLQTTADHSRSLNRWPYAHAFCLRNHHRLSSHAWYVKSCLLTSVLCFPWWSVLFLMRTRCIVCIDQLFTSCFVRGAMCKLSVHKCKPLCSCHYCLFMLFTPFPSVLFMNSVFVAIMRQHMFHLFHCKCRLLLAWALHCCFAVASWQHATWPHTSFSHWSGPPACGLRLPRHFDFTMHNYMCACI